MASRLPVDTSPAWLSALGVGKEEGARGSREHECWVLDWTPARAERRALCTLTSSCDSPAPLSWANHSLGRALLRAALGWWLCGWSSLPLGPPVLTGLPGARQEGAWEGRSL